MALIGPRQRKIALPKLMLYLPTPWQMQIAVDVEFVDQACQRWHAIVSTSSDAGCSSFEHDAARAAARAISYPRRLEDHYHEPGTRQMKGRRHPGQPASDNGDIDHPRNWSRFAHERT